MATATQSPESGTIPSKLFYRINEVARITGLKPYVLRYWESEFSELSPSKDSSDQRRYRRSDIDVVLTIRKLLYEDRYTIKGARKVLRDEIKQRRSSTAPSGSKRAAGGRHAPHAGRQARQPTVRKPEVQMCLSRLRNEVTELLAMLGGE